jgi:O-antigen/teichoic acid export membrane protein
MPNYLKKVLLNSIEISFTLNFVGRSLSALVHLSAAALINPIEMGIINQINSIVSIQNFLNFSGLMDLLLRGKSNLQTNFLIYRAIIGNIIGYLVFLIYTIEFVEKKSIIFYPLIIGISQLPLHALYIKGSLKLKQSGRFFPLSILQLLQIVSFSLIYIELLINKFSVYSYVIANILQLVIGLIILKLFTKNIEWKNSGVPSDNYSNKDFYQKSFWHMLYIGLSSIFFQIPIIISSQFLDAINFGYFSWGLTIASQIFLLFSSLSRNIIAPQISNQLDNESFSDKWVKSTRIKIMIYMFIVTLLALAIVRYLLPIIYSNKWDKSLPCISILMAAMPIMSLRIITESQLIATKKYKENALIHLLAVVIIAISTLVGGLGNDIVQLSLSVGVGYLISSVVFIMYSYFLGINSDTEHRNIISEVEGNNL